MFCIGKFIFTFSNSCKQLIMFSLVRIILSFFIKSENGVALIIFYNSGISKYFSFGANNQFIYLAHCFGDMAALAVHNAAIGIVKFYEMVVIYFAIFFIGTNLAAAHALRFYRVSSFKPVHHINIMYMLFNNMIAAKPVKIIPVAHLVFHLCLVGLAFFYPNAIIMPPGLC